MNKKQLVHLAMLNSFNCITGKIDEIVITETSIPMFAHVPNEELLEKNLSAIIKYFEDLEMYEECKELKREYDLRFDSLRRPKDRVCDCNYPTILRYNWEQTRCGICKNLLVK
jgi:hypothetical protein